VRAGDVPVADAYRTFNMGLGLLVVVAEADAERVSQRLRECGEPDVRLVGRIIAGDGVVEYAG
jgi:phosphoribosylformylglycinamidine cyclo-ligase